MRIGFASIYSWRPHVEHMVYLARLVQSAGHEVRFLTCDANLPTCYTRELRPNARANCLICKTGGVRSFERSAITSIGSFHATKNHSDDISDDIYEWSKSSASTIGRFESHMDYAGQDYKGLVTKFAVPTRLAYSAARSWIEQEKLDAVCVFNGRMEVTRAITEAAKAAGIRFVSLERTWFGDGLQLLPNENCLGLNSVDRLVGEWREKPLTERQAYSAASHIASRFLRNNVKEWQAYNTSAISVPWPASGSRKVLLVPGSRNEFYGHPDWLDRWSEKTAAYDALIDQLNLNPADIVLRCHPNWAQYIGQNDGRLSTKYYKDWADRRGVVFIEPSARASTLDLIDQAEIVVVGGSSAGLEAGILGKQIVAISPSTYQAAGFQIETYGPEQMDRLCLFESEDEASEVSRKTLRFAYSTIYRLAQYVDYVRCIDTTKYAYIEGADPARFIALCRSGILAPDDADFAKSLAGEDLVLDLIKRRQWEALAKQSSFPQKGILTNVQRRPAYRAAASLRRLLPLGHQW